jgi:hypothetical protein
LDPFLLIIIVFIVAPLIERILKAGKQAPPPPGAPGRRPQVPPQQRPRPGRPGEYESADEYGGASTQVRLPRPVEEEENEEEELAAGMLPDDLWEILTGERRTPRPPPRTTPPHTPAPVPQDEPEPAYESRYEADYGTALEPYEADEPALYEEVLVDEERASLPELFEREIPVRPSPRVVSLEQLSFDDERRHDQFHHRLDRLPRAATVGGRAGHDYRFTSRADVRRAIIMAEILGTPKGLQPTDHADYRYSDVERRGS